jgi:hypothetical protein
MKRTLLALATLAILAGCAGIENSPPSERTKSNGPDSHTGSRLPPK